MTQEEKAKAYDEALKKARQLCAYPTTKPFISDLQDLFPELKESDDERIRKAIRTLILSVPDIYERIGFSQGECFDWIQKQGEQKPIEWHREDEQKLNACFGYIPDESLRRWLTDIIHIKYDKPGDKVEPKFKVGDWIIYKDNIWKVCNISLGTYYELLKINNEVSIRHFEGVDETAHLWTIQDVKDGDVLVLNNEVFIYAHRKQMYSIAVAHCFVNSAGSFYLDGEFGYKEFGRTISPATQEQRDFLFSKMEEAGYEWDSETKKIINNND
jgi:hypothetical protein